MNDDICQIRNEAFDRVFYAGQNLTKEQVKFEKLRNQGIWSGPTYRATVEALTLAACEYADALKQYEEMVSIKGDAGS